MKVMQHRWSGGAWDAPLPPGDDDADLVLVFGAPSRLEDPDGLPALVGAYPRATIVGCSTSGEIQGTSVLDETVVATAVGFSHSSVRHALVELSSVGGDSALAGEQLGRELDHDELRHVLVFSDGLAVNGSELVRGLAGALPAGVEVTGGLAGDAARFSRTLVVDGGSARPGRLVAVGLYGPRLRLGLGTMGGWDPFGPDRLVTRSEGNVLYEMDGTSALGLYKSYLGPHAAELPGSALLFPLSVRTSDGDAGIVRTVLGVDEDADSITFAGDVPAGSYAQLMHANFDRLIDGATGAARASYEAIGERPAELAILISCVGRKLVLDQRVEEEVESVRDVLGPGAALTGFYSYGEISPMTPGVRCELHNQTMTITTLSED